MGFPHFWEVDSFTGWKDTLLSQSLCYNLDNWALQLDGYEAVRLSHSRVDQEDQEVVLGTLRRLDHWTGTWSSERAAGWVERFNILQSGTFFDQAHETFSWFPFRFRLPACCLWTTLWAPATATRRDRTATPPTWPRWPRTCWCCSENSSYRGVSSGWVRRTFLQ